MTLEEFFKHANRNKWTSVPVMPLAPGGIHWDTYKAMANLTSRVKFDCKFDKNGKCRAARGRNSSWCRCCCDSCHSSLGYLKVLPTNADDLITIANAFDHKGGFWDKDTGCRLPRALRSPTCLGHICGDLRSKRAKPIDPTHKVLLRFFSHWQNHIPEVRGLKQRVEFPLDNGIAYTTVLVDRELLAKIIGPIKWKTYWKPFIARAKR